MQKQIHLLLFLLFFVFQTETKAQRPGGGGRSMPSIGRIYGKVIDAKTKEPVEFSTVTLLALQKDSVISGVLAKSNGDFSLDKLPMGRFRLKVAFIGYKPTLIPVTIGMNNLEQDLGNIAIEVDSKSLKEAVVEGERSQVIMTVDRRIYNVSKDISARGGTGIDAVKNIPGLSVDADGAVTLRNSSPTIFVDGRPTLLTLEQIPADEIDRIEVITNPSARFDASTTGGILNVVLKKNNKPGYNGMINLGVGYPTRQNAMLNLNIKEGRTNFSIMYNFNRSNNIGRGYTNRTTLLNNTETGFYRQTNENDATNMMQNGRFAIDYNLTNRTTITLAQGFMSGGFNTEDNQSFRSLDATSDLLSYGNRLTKQKTGWTNYSTQLQLRKTYPKRGKEFTTDITYNHSDRLNNSDFYTYDYDKQNVLLPPGEQLQRNTGGGFSDNITFQFDFTNPITDTAKWEFGVRSNIRVDRSQLNVDNRDNANPDVFIADTSLTNDYRINDMVNAAYVTYSNMWMGIGYQLGLRFEQTRFRGELVNKNLSYEFYYPDSLGNLHKSFFPSIFLTKRIGEKHEFQLNFTRKINRPGFMQSMPFIMFADKLNYRQGNPNLAPEFTNTMEFNYNYIFGFGNIFTSVYMKATEDPITNFAYPLASDTSGSVLINTFINGNTMYNYGWENNFRVSLFERKLDFSVNANLFYTDISAATASSTISNTGFSWNTKGVVSYKFPKSYTLQVNGNYEAPRIIPQGRTLDQYSIDVSLNKEVMKFLNISLIVNDVFNTRRFGTNFESEFIRQDISRRREVRFVRLTVSLRFGEMDASLFRRKNNRRMEGGGGMDVEY
jgi:hypothetical protein